MQMIELVPDLQPIILAARQARDSRNILADFLPQVEVQSVSYRLGRRRRLDQTVPVRAIDAPATPIRRPGVVDVQGDLPAITPIVDLSEQDLTNEMIMAQQLAGIEVDFTPAVEASAGAAALTVDNTLELMRGQLLSTSVVSLVSADGVTHEVDFGVPTEQKIEAAAPWNGAGAGNEFSDLEAAHSAFVEASGSEAGVVLTTRRVWRRLITALQAAYPHQPVSEAMLAGYLSDRGLPAIRTYDRTFTAYNGTKSRVYPEGTLTFLPADQPVGRTELGVTQEAVQQVQRKVLLANQAPGVTIVTLGDDNPVRRSVKAAAIGMPVLSDTDNIVIMSGLLS